MEAGVGEEGFEELFKVLFGSVDEVGFVEVGVEVGEEGRVCCRAGEGREFGLCNDGSESRGFSADPGEKGGPQVKVREYERG